MSTNLNIANKLIYIMQESGVTVKELSVKTGLARGTISNIRMGRNHYSWQLKLICDELGVPTSVVLDEHTTLEQARAIKALQRVSDKRILAAIHNLITSIQNK